MVHTFTRRQSFDKFDMQLLRHGNMTPGWVALAMEGYTGELLCGKGDTPILMKSDEKKMTLCVQNQCSLQSKCSQ